MKHISNYTNEEILKLTDEEINTVVKLHLADAGIKLIKRPVEPIYFEIAQPDTTIYRITGIDIVFEKREPAEQIAKILRESFSSLKKHNYDWNNGAKIEYCNSLTSDYSFSDGLASIQVSEVKVYSPELRAMITDKVRDNGILKKKYEDDLKEYETHYESEAEIRDMVWNKVNEVREAQREKEAMLETFREYLDLAKNDKDVAWSFMNKAYSVTTEVKDYIEANIGGGK